MLHGTDTLVVRFPGHGIVRSVFAVRLFSLRNISSNLCEFLQLPDP